MKSNTLLITFIILFITACGSPGDGVVMTIAGKRLVKDILSDLRRTSNQLIYNGKSAGNSLIAKFGNELGVTADNFNILLKDDLNTTFDKLTYQNQLLLNQTELFRLQFIDVKSGAFDLKDAVVLDTKRLVGDVLPWAKTDYYIQTIKGLTQIVSDKKSYEFEITGIGFGTNSDNYISNLKSIKVNGKSINQSDFIENKIGANVSKVLLKNNAIKLNSTLDSVKLVNVKFYTEVTTRKGILWKVPKTHTYESEVFISYIPDKIKNVKLNYIYTSSSYKNPVTTNFRYITPDHNQPDASHDEIITFTEVDPETHRIDNNHRYTNLRNIRRDGSGCAWTNPIAFNLINDPDGNARSTNLVVSTNGLPCVYFFEATIESLTDEDVSAPDQTIDFTYSQEIGFKVPKKTKLWILSGQMADFSEFKISTGSNYKDIIVFSRKVELTNYDMIYYKIKSPL